MIRRSFTLRMLLVSSFFVISSFSSASCQTNHTKEKEIAQEQQKPEDKKQYVMEIDATYMKKHLYDFEANPTQFVYKGDKPAIIDFYADWCGPCRLLGPKLKEAVERNNGNVMLYKINVDKNSELANHFGVQSIPMVLFVPKKGKPIQTVGNISRDVIDQYIQKILTTQE